MLNNNHIRDCPITLEDVRRSLHIYGPDIGTLKGKTTRKQPAHIPTQHIIPVLMNIRTFYRRITLCVDLFYVTKQSFYCTTSRDLGFSTVQLIQKETYSNLLSRTQTVLDLYAARGFKVEHIRVDRQLECLEESLRPIHLHIAAPGQHVPEVERTIRTLKKDIRTTVDGLPYKCFTHLMVRHAIIFHTHLRNIRISNNNICRNISPYTILTGKPNPSFHDFKLEFGAYSQVSEIPGYTNTQDTHTIGAISLGPSNDEGGWYFLSLLSGKRITRYTWKALPLPKEVIDRVNTLAQSEGMPLLQSNDYFEWQPGDPLKPIDDENITPEPIINIEGADNNDEFEETDADIDEAEQAYITDQKRFDDNEDEVNPDDNNAYENEQPNNLQNNFYTPHIDDNDDVDDQINTER